MWLDHICVLIVLIYAFCHAWCFVGLNKGKKRTKEEKYHRNTSISISIIRFKSNKSRIAWINQLIPQLLSNSAVESVTKLFQIIPLIFLMKNAASSPVSTTFTTRCYVVNMLIYRLPHDYHLIIMTKKKTQRQGKLQTIAKIEYKRASFLLKTKNFCKVSLASYCWRTWHIAYWFIQSYTVILPFFSHIAYFSFNICCVCDANEGQANVCAVHIKCIKHEQPNS